MLGFPGYNFLGFLAPLALLGLAAFFFGLRDFSKSKKYALSYFRPAIGILVGTVFIGGGLFFSAGNFRQVYGFRNIPVGRVNGFRVYRSAGEYGPDDPRFVVYDNPEKAQAALKTLRNCTVTRRNHETFTDGFKLRILIAGETEESDYFLSVYRQSSSRSGRTTVTPHRGPVKTFNLGDYECPEFQSFVRENIDPLFQNNSSPAK